MRMLKSPVRRNEAVDLGRDGLNVDTCKARLHGVEGVTLGEQHQNHGKLKRNPCRIRTQTRASQQNHHISCVCDAVVE